jgi:hypothetical protein
VKEESSSWFGFHFTMFEDKTRASLFLGHNWGRQISASDVCVDILKIVEEKIWVAHFWVKTFKKSFDEMSEYE